MSAWDASGQANIHPIFSDSAINPGSQKQPLGKFVYEIEIFIGRVLEKDNGLCLIYEV